MSDENNIAQATAALIQKKSMAVGVLLALFFGPLGLFYSSVPGGLILMLVGIPLAIVTGGLGLIPVAIASVIWAVVAIGRHNGKLIKSINTGT